MAENKNEKKARPTQEKRVETANKANLNNVSKRSKIKTAIKDFKEAVAANDKNLAEEKLNNCISLLNRAKSDGLYHANTVSRKVSSLTKLFNTVK